MAFTQSSSPGAGERHGVVSEDGNDLLFEAAQMGRVSDVRHLIKDEHCDPMSRDKCGETVLHWAAFFGRLQLVQCLIDEFGVDTNSCQDDQGRTPLHAAAGGGKLSVLRYLIKEKHCDPMSRDEDGWTVLHWAAFYGQLQVVQCFIDEFGVDPNSCRGDKGWTPLHAAAGRGKLRVLRYLIKEKHCDPNSRDEDGWTVLHWAAFYSRLQVLRCLINEFGMDPNSCRDDKGWTPLHVAAQDGELSVLRYLIKEKHCDAMSRDENGWTILHWAAYNGHLKSVQFLVEECGACIDFKWSGILFPRIQEYFKVTGVKKQKLNATSDCPIPTLTNTYSIPPPSTKRKRKLASKDLHQISSYLHEVPNEDLVRLGVALGLSYNKLKRLDKGTFLLDMLSMWLRKEDDVIKFGGPPTWGSLVKALRVDTVAQNGIADTIEECHL